MKHKLIPILIIICVLVSAGLLIAETVNFVKEKPDTIEINEIKHNAESVNNFLNYSYDSIYDFTIVDLDGAVLFTTKKVDDISIVERINQAILNYDTVIDYEKNGIVEGKIIIYTGQILEGNRAGRIAAVVIPFSVLCILLVLYYLYMRVYLYRPFKRLKNFAVDIAAGNLDLPLPMDKDNLFGEFSESFDLMREELKAAKQKAVLEEKSKKELIATLSHDIKTPVSIVRAASELLEMNETNPKKLTNIKTIQSKTLEIDRLIMDLFSSALNDLSELKINVINIESALIGDLAKSADQFENVIFKNQIPECLVKADTFRIKQVFGNIISNSDKYAGTVIEVSFYIEAGFLKISFKDSGVSFDKTELPFILTKFYRGKNASDKQGTGLGLYICSELLDRMGGKLEVKPENDGFTVNVNLALS